MNKSLDVERGAAVLQCIASDEKLLKALGMAKTLYKIKGNVPTELVVRLNDSVSGHIRTHAYKYDKLISLELVRIQRLKHIQLRFAQLTSSAVIAIIIGSLNLPLTAVGNMVVVALLLCCCSCYNRRVFVRGARWLCAPRRNPGWQKVHVAEEAAAARTA